MSVWHISGLGLSPGAVTVPLTYIYLMQKSAALGNMKAKEFFETSGEIGQDIKGTPEALILFTSEDVITGRKGSPSRDKWFNTDGKQDVPKTMAKYIKSLINGLRDENFQVDHDGIKYVYLIKVNHEDYGDCFFNAYITLKGLHDKEIWINMIGGTNQINSALLTAGGLTGVSARYYYFFQKFEDTGFLHPNIKRPNLKNPGIEIPPKGWYELPVFWLDAAKLIGCLNRIFEGRRRVNVGEIKALLKNLKLPDSYFIKLTGSRLVKRADRDTVVKGEALDLWNTSLESVEKESEDVTNSSKWKRWASERGILWRLTLDGKCEKVE